MKKLLLIIMALLIVTNIQGQDLKRYQIKSAIIEYKIEGSSEGTETLYFDNYGQKEAKRTKLKTTMMGFTQETDQLIVLDKNWIYTADFKTKTITKMENPSYEMLMELTKENTELEKLSSAMMENMGGKMIGTESIDGKKCDVWEVASLGSKMWIHKSIPLKTVVNMMGMNITYKTTKIQLNVPVPSSKFELPKGFKEQEAPNMQEMMKNMKKMLK